MPSRKRHFKGNNRSQDKRRRQENEKEWKQRRDTRDEYITEPKNEKFEAFYQAQLQLSEDDWDAFLEALRRPLPACFRINPTYAFADELKKQLLEFAGQSQVVDGTEIPSVQQLQWYPSGDGYKLGTDRRTLRKSSALEPLHKWMMLHTDCGNITRQEAVSMVPPLALNVLPHHKCLDMCASPGSKTSQLLEVINESLGNSDEKGEGLVIANDCDTDRAYMLVHQCRRINSPLLLVTTHKGQEYPTVLPESMSSPIPSSKLERSNGIFDRVLCDVPCSGDGTLRKTPNIWGKWGIGSACSLYPLQIMIAQRGLRLVKYGGLMVYSTCSMSPYEDEAVIAEILRTNKGSVELVDAREFVPQFKARPGLSHWAVLNDYDIPKKSQKEDAKESEGDMEVEKVTESTDNVAELRGMERCLSMGMREYKSYEDVPESLQRKYRPMIFPPTDEEKEWMHLEKCLRCLPQDEDTGGFFVATLRRVVPPELQEEANTTTTTENNTVEENVEGSDSKGEELVTTEEPVGRKKFARGERKLIDFQQWDSEAFASLKQFFGLEDLTGEEFYTREDFTSGNNKNAGGGNNSKSVYYMPKSVRDVLRGDTHKRLKVVSAGIKVFERSAKGAFAGGGDCGYRLMQDGVAIMAPFVKTRKVGVTIQDFCNFLGGGLVSFSTLSKETLSVISAMPSGSLICYYDFNPQDVVEGAPSIPLPSKIPRFHLVCWRGQSATLNVMCSKTEIESVKHQMDALKVLRPKISAKRTAAAVPQEDNSDTVPVNEQEVKSECADETVDEPATESCDTVNTESEKVCTKED